MGIHYSRGLVLYQQRRFEDALKEFEAELGESPGCPQSTCMKACCLEAMHKTDKALFWARSAVGLNPENSLAFHVLGRTLYQKEGYPRKEVVEAFKTAISLNSNDVQNYLYLAQIHMYIARWKEALMWAQRGLQVAARDSRCLAISGWSHFNLGDTDQALEQLQQSLECDPTNATAHRFLARVAVFRGDIDLAREHITESHRVDPRPVVDQMQPLAFSQNILTSHDLMYRIVLAQGTLYGKVLSLGARANHLSVVLEARYGAWFTIPVLGVLIVCAIICSQLDKHDHQLANTVATFIFCVLGIALAIPLSLWLVALVKMMRDKSKRSYFTERQKRALLAAPTALAVIAIIAGLGMWQAEKQQADVVALLRQARDLEEKGQYQLASVTLQKAVSKCRGPGVSLSAYRARFAAHQAGLAVDAPSQAGGPYEEKQPAVLKVILDASYKKLLARAQATNANPSIKKSLESDYAESLGQVSQMP